jgi:sugar lactone lactonase YvrE
MRFDRILQTALVALTLTLLPQLSEAKPVTTPTARQIVTGLAGSFGSTIGPDGALYVTEALAGRVSRINPRTGAVTTFASGLPQAINGVGGAFDVTFLDGRAYVLVTLVGPDVGGSSVVGVYRVDGPSTFTVIADIGAFSIQHPPSTSFFVPSGVQYAIQNFRGGFLVSDGHHNRVLRVTLDGTVTEVLAFDNIVPTGLAVWGNRIFMAEAGPVPHMPQDGKVVSFTPRSTTATEVGSGASLLVDVEFGQGRRLYALSQGPGVPDAPEGSPAQPNTGTLVEVNGDGTFTAIVNNLDRPTSLDFIGNTAFVVTLTGEVWRIDHVSRPPFGHSH